MLLVSTKNKKTISITLFTTHVSCELVCVFHVKNRPDASVVLDLLQELSAGNPKANQLPLIGALSPFSAGVAWRLSAPMCFDGLDRFVAYPEVAKKNVLAHKARETSKSRDMLRQTAHGYLS